MSTLRISLVQTSLYWKSAEANRAMFEEKLASLAGHTDLIILPEMFTTGFTMDAEEVAEPVNFSTYRWMRLMASRTNAVVAGSVVISENGAFYNRLLWAEPTGNILHYDKRHLFRMAKDHDHYHAGSEKIICSLKGWKVAPFVCYDLRFPVWIRNTYSEATWAYDLALFVANWPSPRANAWEILLKARAIENSCYVAGVNRIGTDGADVSYSGGSQVVDPKGTSLIHMGEQEEIQTIPLNKDELESYRKKFPVQLDADRFRLGQ